MAESSPKDGLRALDELVGHDLDQLERVGALEVAGLLDVSQTAAVGSRAPPPRGLRVDRPRSRSTRGASQWTRATRRYATGPYVTRVMRLAVMWLAVALAAQCACEGGEEGARPRHGRRHRLSEPLSGGATGSPATRLSPREVGPRHDPIHEAVAEPELGALIAGRQLLADRSGRDRSPAKRMSGWARRC